jgi:hypothetical protein
MDSVRGSKGENMKLAKNLTDRMPDRPKTVLVQADIDYELHARVKEKIDKLKKTKMVTWKVLIEVALERFLEEV